IDRFVIAYDTNKRVIAVETILQVYPELLKEDNLERLKPILIAVLDYLDNVVFEILIRHGLNPNVKIYYECPLLSSIINRMQLEDYSSFKKLFRMMEKILDQGANPNSVDMNGVPAFDVAIFLFDENVFR